MADPFAIEQLRAGKDAWNIWRKAEPDLRPDLRNADLAGAMMDFGVNLSRVDLTNANLSRSDLSGASFVDADVKGTDFTRAELRKTFWRRADARGAVFRGSRFHRAVLSGGDFRSADFSDASLDVQAASGARLDDARLTGFRHEKYPTAMNDWDCSPLELLFVDGLERVSEESRPDVAAYIAFAFDYLHDLDTDEAMYYEKYRENAIQRADSIMALFERPVPSAELIRALQAVDSGLLEYVSRRPAELNNLHWRAFEELIADLLAVNGWKVELTSPTRDGGYDLLGIYKDSLGIRQSWIVECKRWRNERPIGIEVIRGLYAVKMELNVSGALLATTSQFTRGALQFSASHYDLELRDRNNVIEWLNAYRDKGVSRFAIRANRIVLEK